MHLPACHSNERPGITKKGIFHHHNIHHQKLLKLTIGRDKWKHFFVGIAMGAVLQLAGWWLLPGHLFLATAIVFLVVVSISYGFELFSKFTGMGVYEVMDAVFSIAGGIIGMGITLLSLHARH